MGGLLPHAEADVAQLVEQLIRNQQVIGSSPIVGSISRKRGLTHHRTILIRTSDMDRPSTIALARQLCRYCVAFIWIYQGLVPKLLFHSAEETAMNVAAGFTAAGAVRFSNFAGAAEIALGLLILFTRWRWPLVLTILLMAALTIVVAVVKPIYLAGAFNAITLNTATAALAATAFLLTEKKF
jgi:hypothetical protein